MEMGTLIEKKSPTIESNHTIVRQSGATLIYKKIQGVDFKSGYHRFDDFALGNYVYYYLNTHIYFTLL